MNPKDKEIAVAYQNKDIVSKVFGERMKGKPLSLFGLGTDLKVSDIRPTNLPVVQARELRMDNLFELEDGSVAILDYESKYKKTNFTKYGRYMMDVTDRYLKEGREPDVRMMVLYTADIEEREEELRRSGFSIRIEASYLSGAPSEEWLEDAGRRIAAGEATDETLMHVVMLPLTYKGWEKKQEAIRKCVDLARGIGDREQQSFALAGILSFTDKVISEETKTYVKEALGMTQVGKMLMDEGRREGRQEGRREGRQEGDLARAKKTAVKMLKRGDSLREVAELLEVPADMVRAWEEESCAMA